MKFATDRPFADPEKTARKMIEIANATEALALVGTKGFLNDLLGIVGR